MLFAKSVLALSFVVALVQAAKGPVITNKASSPLGVSCRRFSRANVAFLLDQQVYFDVKHGDKVSWLVYVSCWPPRGRSWRESVTDLALD
jgi:hypothetical protein